MKKLIKTLKHIFISPAGIAVILFSALVLLVASFGIKFYIQNTNMTATVLPAVLIDLTNQTRTSNNEVTLNRNPILDKVAKMKAEDMAHFGYFTHTSPTGVTPWYWFDKAGYYFSYAGENLAINFDESKDVENAWLNSPTHKANILNNHFTEIGMATAKGVYQGKSTTFVVQEFGKPALVNNDSISASAITGEQALLDNLETITDTTDFIIVKNKNVQDPQDQSITHLKWYNKVMSLMKIF